MFFLNVLHFSCKAVYFSFVYLLCLKVYKIKKKKERAHEKWLWAKKEEMTELWSWVTHCGAESCAFLLCLCHGAEVGKEETDSLGSTSASFCYPALLTHIQDKFPNYTPPTLLVFSFLLSQTITFSLYKMDGSKAVATGLETLSRITPPSPGDLLSCPTLYQMF